MRYLRTNTAVRITVGPFLDKSDGITPETSLTATNEKLTLVVDDSNVPTLVIDANATASGGNNDFVHITGDDAGFYDLELTAAQTNYLGRAMLSITYATDHCPVFHEFMILPAMIYDSFVLGTDRLDTNVTHIGDTSQTARDIGASVLLSSGTGTGQVKLSSGYVAPNWGDVGNPTTTVSLSGTTVATTSDVTNRVRANLEQINGTSIAGTSTRVADAFVTMFNVASPVFTVASVNQGADNNVILANGTYGNSALKSLIDAVDNFVDTEVASIATDVGTLLTRLGTPSNLGGGATVAANLSDIEAQTDDIGTAGAGLTAVPWNAAWDAEVQSEVQDAVEANNLDHLFAVAITTGDVANNSFASKITSKSATADYSSFVNTTDSLQAIRDGLVNAAAMGDNYASNGFLITRAQGVNAPETIGSTGNSTTTIHVPNWGYGNDEINDMLIIIYDNDQGEYHSRWVDDWVNSTKLVTVATLPFTPEDGVDIVYLYPNRRNAHTISGTTTTLDALQTALNSAHGSGSWATATGFSTHTAADIWAVATRTLTAGTNIALAKGTGVTGFTDIDAAGVRTAIGLGSANLDTQLDALPTNAELATALAGADDAVLAAIAALNNLSQANVRSALGMSSANLDTQLSNLASAVDAVDNYVDTEMSALTSAVGSLWTTTITESYGADGAAVTPAQALYEIMQQLGERSFSGVTGTVKKRDGSTTAFTQTLNDSVTPTAVTRA